MAFAVDLVKGSWAGMVGGILDLAFPPLDGNNSRQTEEGVSQENIS